LGARALYRWPFPSVQQAELDPRAVRNTPHDAIHGVNLAHKVALPKSTNSRVARHYTDAVERQGNKRRTHPHSRSGMRSLGPRVPATDHNDIILRMFHVKHSLLSNAKAAEYLIEKRFDIHAPHKCIYRSNGRSDILSQKIYFIAII
jgi:hypothetical protein